MKPRRAQLFIAICAISLSACSTARISPQGIISSRIGTEFVFVNNPFGADAQNDIEPESSKSDTTGKFEVPDSIAFRFSPASGSYLSDAEPIDDDILNWLKAGGWQRSWFTEVSSCSEIDNVSIAAKEIAAGDPILVLSRLPSETTSRFYMFPPEEWGNQYDVRDDSASGKTLFFFHDGKTINRIAYTTEAKFRADIVVELPPMQFSTPWDLRGDPRWDGGALIYDDSLLERNRSVLIDDTRRSAPR